MLHFEHLSYRIIGAAFRARGDERRAHHRDTEAQRWN